MSTHINDLANNLTPLASALSVAPAAMSSGNGTGVDMELAANNQMFAILATATIVGTLDVTLEESTDDSTYTAISGASFTQVTTANDNQVQVINFQRTKRYVRSVQTLSGGGSVIGTVIIVGQKSFFQ